MPHKKHFSVFISKIPLKTQHFLENKTQNTSPKKKTKRVESSLFTVKATPSTEVGEVDLPPPHPH
jgi:hypothetical protein